MSLSTGIKISPSLKDDFKSLKHKIMFVNIKSVDGEQMIDSTHWVDQIPSDNEMSQYSTIQEYVKETCPKVDKSFYVIYQKNSGQHLLITFIPDNAPVKEKMLYSSTKSYLLKQLGDSLFSDTTIYCNQLNDLSLKYYEMHCKSQVAAPLTAREVEINQIKLDLSSVPISTSTKQSFNNGISLQIASPDTIASFPKTARDIHGHPPQLLIFSIDEQEVIQVEAYSYEWSSLVPTILEHLPKDSPRFCLFAHKSRLDQKKIVFLYTCPLESSIKKRMVYSASRQALITDVSNLVKIDVKCELADLSDLSLAFLDMECGFQASSLTTTPLSQSGFIKKGLSVPGSGSRRLVKKSEAQLSQFYS